MKNRNFGLDVVRALAILLVMLCHFARPTKVLGVLGVELFFALSGFLIGGIFLREIYSTRSFGVKDCYRFLRRRWYRTLPNFYLFLGVFLLVWPIIGRRIPGDLWKYLLFLQNLAWPMEGFFVYSWSLAIEEWFYLLFAGLSVVLLIATKSRKVAIGSTVMLMLVVPTILRFARGAAADWDGGLHMIVLYRLDALMYGVIMAWLKFRRADLFRRLRWLAIPGAAVAIGATVAAQKLYAPQHPAELPAIVLTVLPLACACLLPFAQDLPTTGTMLDGAVTNISLWSYSLYLSHPAILYLAYHFTDPVIHSFSGKALVKLACLALSFLVSKLTFQYFETPIMNLRDRTPNRRALPSAELVSGD